MKRRYQSPLMLAGEEIFWEEFEKDEREGERYVVIDQNKREIVVEDARLTKKKKRIRV